MLIVLLILSFLVIIHELGHFLVAKWRGVRVEEFGLGYPPRIKKLFTYKNTDFTLNWIPFGGFVKLLGEDQQPDRESTIKTGRFDKANTFSKLAILLAGASVNFLFGVIIFGVVFSNLGIPEFVEEARIGEVAPGSPAEASGLPKQVTVTQLIDDQQVTHSVEKFEELVALVDERKGQQITLVTTGECGGYSCEESLHQYQMTVRTDDQIPDNQGALGVVWGPAYVQYPPLEMPFRSAWYGLQQALFLGMQILFALQKLFTDLITHGQVPSDIAGPVGIIDQVSSSGLLQEGVISILFFAGMLSVNLAIMNILPIPPLDGGRALFVCLSMIFKGKRITKIEYYANYTGYILLLIAIVLVTIRDVVRVIG